MSIEILRAKKKKKYSERNKFQEYPQTVGQVQK